MATPLGGKAQSTDADTANAPELDGKIALFDDRKKLCTIATLHV
jgi:hypothetical protein